MILYPLSSELAPPSRALVPVWDVVARRQKQPASDWWLVAQPDHAALAGDLAASIHSPELPSLDADVIQAITLHDAGWAPFDGGEPRGIGIPNALTKPQPVSTERPQSFLDATPADFLLAWAGSIERAEKSSPIGGIIVSEHFTRLGEMRLSIKADRSDDVRRIHEFLEREADRRAALALQDRHSVSERALLVDVLQFCDLLSLYLCSGAHDNVEFPQHFAGRALRLKRAAEECRMEPPLFGSGVSLGVTARRHPTSFHSFVTIPFLLV